MASIPSTPTIPTTSSPPTRPPPKPPVKAKAGDYLCMFAADQGFKDCDDFRTDSRNTAIANKAVLDKGDNVYIPEKDEESTSGMDKTVVKCKRVQYPPATLRFLGQGTSMNSRRSAGLARLGISDYRTDKTSKNQTGTEKDLYKLQGADDDASRTTPEDETYADPDHFRVEVHDVTAAGKSKPQVEVELQVLQPLYKRATEGSDTVVVRDTTTRPNPDAPAGFKIPGSASRKLTVICKRVKKTPYYRSKYLRLVTHTEDNIADHTLYVGDYFDDGANEDEKRYTEILEQKVRARYTPAMCTQAKCRAETLADVGEMQGEIRLVVHIMDNAVDYADIRRVVYKQVRRTYAAAHVRPYLVKVHKHPAIENIVLLGNANGTAAPPSGISGLFSEIGAMISPSKITVKVDGNTIEHRPGAYDTVAATAAALTAKITAAGLFVKELADPYTPSAGLEKARMLLVFKDAEFTNYSKVTSATSTDTRLSVANYQVSSAKLGSFPQDENSIYHRILKACCDTKRFDMIVLKAFDSSSGSTLFGIATWIHKEFGPCAIVQSDRVKPAVDNRYTFSHEMGHVLMHGGHFTDAARQEQLMLQGGSVVGDANQMPGRRRISDAPMEMRYEAFDDAAGTWTGVSLLKAGDPHGTLVSRIHKFVTGDAFGGPTAKRIIGTEW